MPPPPPTKVKGKVQQLLCTQYRTFRPKIPSAAYDLAPQTETTTVCLAFFINPSSMQYSDRGLRYITGSIEISENVLKTFNQELLGGFDS